MMRRLAIFAVLASVLAAPALAEQFQTVPDKSVIGRIGTGSGAGPSQAIAMDTLAIQLSAKGLTYAPIAKVASATIANGGTCSFVNSTGNVTTSGGSGTQATISVTTNVFGVVTSVNSVVSPGAWYINPPTPNPVTGCVGTLLNLVFTGATSGNTVMIGADQSHLADGGYPPVQSKTCSSHNWLSSLSGGILGCSQPSFSDLAGTLASGQISANAVANANMATMGAYSLKGNTSGSSGTPTDFTIGGLTQKANPATTDLLLLQDQAASGALKYVTVSAIAAGGAVGSVGGLTGTVGLGNGLTTSSNNVVTSLSTAFNVLGGDIALNNTGLYFDGPSMAQGTTGTWFSGGTVTLSDSTAAQFYCKLWDGTTILASSVQYAPASAPVSMHLSGTIASPAANIRISCRDVTNTTGLIKFNQTGNSKDSSIYGFRIQ